LPGRRKGGHLERRAGRVGRCLADRRTDRRALAGGRAEQAQRPVAAAAGIFPRPPRNCTAEPGASPRSGGPTSGELRAAAIARLRGDQGRCAQNDIDHRLTKPKHPWTNGQVERMNRTLKEATVRRYYYQTHGQLRSHFADFVSAYNFARQLKGLTPYYAARHPRRAT
jgi:transposase InsO family protein